MKERDIDLWDESTKLFCTLLRNVMGLLYLEKKRGTTNRHMILLKNDIASYRQKQGNFWMMPKDMDIKPHRKLIRLMHIKQETKQKTSKKQKRKDISGNG